VANPHDSELAAVYNKLMQSDDTAQKLDAFKAASSMEIDLGEKLHLALLPGAFYREFPKHGADGARIVLAANSLGIPIRRIPLPSFCGVSDGAKRIAQWLKAWEGPPLVIVSLSKSALDMRELCHNPENRSLLNKVRAWVSVSGIIQGTPLVDILELSLVRKYFIRLFFMLKSYSYSELRELNYFAPGIKGSSSIELPFPSYHIVGFPLMDDLSSKLSRRSAKRLADYGVSDGGGVLLKDTISYPGTVIPLLGYDHFLKGISETQLLRGIAALVQEDEGNKACSTNASE
jgi:hypothetical protein